MEISGVEDARPAFEELISSCKSDTDRLGVYQAWIESAAAGAEVARGSLMQVDGRRPSDYLEEKERLIKTALQHFPDNRSVSLPFFAFMRIPEVPSLMCKPWYSCGFHTKTAPSAHTKHLKSSLDI